jgi:hypothetical protein
VSDPDTWLHLRIGTFLLDGGRFTHSDPWAVGNSRPYVPNQWLGEIVGTWVYGMAGLPGIAFLRLLAITAFVATLLLTCRTVADPFPASLAVIGATVASLGAFGERPQLFGLVLLVVVWGAWWKTLQDHRPRWWVVPAFWLFACAHGLWIVGVAIGAVVTVGLALDRASRRVVGKLSLLTVLCAAAAALTPLGPQLLLNPFQVNGAAAGHVQEWQAPTIHNAYLAIVLGQAALILVLWLRRASPVPASRILVLLVSVGAALWMARLVVVGAVLLAPLLAEALQNLRHRPPAGRQRRELTTWTVAGAVTLALGLVLSVAEAQEPDGVPLGLAGSLHSLPTGADVVVDHGLSGWLMWERPDLHPTLDLRSEIYPDAAFSDYLRLMHTAPGWQAVLRSTGATVALVPADAPLVDALQRQLNWHVVAGDMGYVLVIGKP